MDWKLELDKIAKSIDEKKAEQIRLQERLKALQEEKNTLLAELHQYGLTAETAVDYINNTETMIAEQITELKKQLGI